MFTLRAIGLKCNIENILEAIDTYVGFYLKIEDSSDAYCWYVYRVREDSYELSTETPTMYSVNINRAFLVDILQVLAQHSSVAERVKIVNDMCEPFIKQN